jgi:hypothetical protein
MVLTMGATFIFAPGQSAAEFEHLLCLDFDLRYPLIQLL